MSSARVPNSAFAAQALGGGASRSIYDLTPPPERGFMVGGAPDRSGTPYRERVIAIHKFNEQSVANHARKMAAEVPNPDRNVYQGAWREKNHVVLDASQHFENKLEATHVARMRNQRAIYDLQSGSDVDTTPGQHKAGAHKARLFRDVVTPAKGGGAHLPTSHKKVEPTGGAHLPGVHKA